ncbi:helix-turn-helix domain-containing protein [Noviherbaspirillum denitrificans]|uniref:helix-turn-helix domain-containing protein n=1 Tax=Noviherbaspirillum denitrificans TaxID=1968433 RepID=UPI000B534C2E|nr:helix-turn-helix transcriptional regulator [Noviherbaspirillum denitrificans]
MDPRRTFGQALRAARKSKGISQEEFSVVSSRTYVSSIERGIKSPTVEKIDNLASALKIHPVSLLLLAYMQDKENNLDALLQRIRGEVSEILDEN